MSLWRHFTRGVRGLLDRGTADRDVRDEVEHYLEQATADLEERGLSRDEARRTARLELGDAAAIRDEVRAYGWENVVSTCAADLRYAIRRLHHSPGFTATVAVTLALGIGATTAIFSAVNPILFEPLPYPQPGRLAMIWEATADGERMATTFGTYRGLVERSRSFEAIAVMKPWQPAMTGRSLPERFEGQRVSAGFFLVLGVHAALGRTFQPSDDVFRGPNVVILSDALWRRRFGGDRDIVGRAILLDDNPFTVIGVMPASFENVLAPDAEVWAPLQYNTSLPADGREWGHHLRMAGRLRSGVSLEWARNELQVVMRALARIYVKGYDSSGGAPAGFVVNSLQADIASGVRPALRAVIGAVILLLTIACVNVTGLLLARGAQRRGEFAMRAALGAGRGRLARQIVTESLVLAVLGGALGIGLAELGVRALVALAPPALPRVAAMTVSGSVFAFALVVTTLAGLLVGLVPAIQASRGDLHGRTQEESRRTAGSHQVARRALVVAEIALALMLLVSAGLLLHSLQRLFAVAPGFDASHLLTMQVQETGHRFDTAAARYRFFDDVREAVRRIPGVEAVGFTSQLPVSGDYEIYGVQFEKDRSANGEGAYRYAVSPGYLETMRIPLRRGRLLDEHDTGEAPAVVLINESFAKRKFHGEDPIGQRVRLGPDVGHSGRPGATIVGVVGDVKQESLAVAEEDAFYVPTKQWIWADKVLSLVVRVRGEAPAFAPAVRSAIWSVDRDQPIVRVATMDDLLARSAAERRFALMLFEAFALVALVLAATGIYGVLAAGVTERTREIGVRSALGASRRDIVRLVLGQAMTLTALGIVLGVGGAAAASRGIASLLFGVSPLDPMTYGGVLVLLCGVSAIACWAPAWRVARIDPAVTLRAE